jgi:ABC-type transporter Mla maintaining outer membrane lipid asymmetry ATPase subunit MlaF
LLQPLRTHGDGALVELSHVVMAFGNRPVFDDLCTFPAGMISAVLGGSGSGKSTLPWGLPIALGRPPC